MSDERRPAATMRDVAARAGVSTMTVSRVINAPGRVSPETRLRVETAIGETGFLPDPVAKELAAARRDRRHAAPEVRLGLAYPEAQAARLGAILAMLFEWAGAAGMRLQPVPVPGTPTSAKAMFARLGSLDALVLLPGAESCANGCPPGLPLVAIAPEREAPALASVSVDEEASGFAIGQDLIFFGHERIGFLGDVRGSEADRARLAGLRAALRKFGAEPDPMLIVDAVSPHHAAMTQAATQLLLRPEAMLPTAILAGRAELAVACLAAANARGLRVPEELAIYVFDDAAGTAAAWPELGRGAFPIADLCREGFAMLGEQIARARDEEPLPAPRQLSFPRTLQHSGSYISARLHRRAQNDTQSALLRLRSG